MAFIAGIVNFGNPIKAETKSDFINGLQVMDSRLPWDLTILERKNFIIAQAGFLDMWQGPKIDDNKGYVAAGTGLQ